MTAAADPALAMVPVPAAPSAREAWERAHLSPAEAALLGDRAAEKRRAEFVAGRLAAKAAAALLLGPPWRREDVTILRDGAGPTGPPRVALARADRPVDASISHADRLAVAAASRCAVGVDLVAVEDHGPAFETDAFAAGELEGWRSFLGATGSRLTPVAIGFGAKEAALKWARTGLTVPLQEVSVRPSWDGVAQGTGSVLALDGAGYAGVVRAPELRLHVTVGGRNASPTVLAARILHLWSRIVFVLWGPRR